MKLLNTKNTFNMFTYLIMALFSFACMAPTESDTIADQPLDPKFDKYWNAGKAEITSYKLTQARYGELRQGTAVTIFVTEPFSKKAMTKADRPTKADPAVMKLNFTKNFITGVYPYSLMNSTFFPIKNGTHSLKISSSSQEWCGHTYMELQNKSKFNIKVDSYFEGASENITLAKDILEDDIWSMIRIQPDALPTGSLKMIPAFFYIRLNHVPTQAYPVTAELKDTKDNTKTYTLNYPDLDRRMSIVFENEFPHKILSWEETYVDGFGPNKKKLTTRGEVMGSIMSAYWGKHGAGDLGLRKELGLE